MACSEPSLLVGLVVRPRRKVTSACPMRASAFSARQLALQPFAFARQSDCGLSSPVSSDLDSRLHPALVAGSASNDQVVRPVRSHQYRCFWVVYVALSILSGVAFVYRIGCVVLRRR